MRSIELPERFVMTSECEGFSEESLNGYLVNQCYLGDEGEAEINLSRRTDWESGRWSRQVTDLIWTKKDAMFDGKAIYVVEFFQKKSSWFDGEEFSFSEFSRSRLCLNTKTKQEKM
ncbi:MAG TPA: hypothetical protein V6D33_12635 [Cyanophyceae cyanobacterium]